MPLDAATFLTLALTCAPQVSPHTLLAIARVESGLDPLALGVNGADGPVARVRDLDAAVAEAGRWIARGKSVDLGLAQINSRNLAGLGLTVRKAFDPCRNLAAGAAILHRGYRRAEPAARGEQAALRIALSYYNTGDPDRGARNGYVRRVVAAAGRPPRSVLSPLPSPKTRPTASSRARDVFAGRHDVRPFVLTLNTGDAP